MPGSGRSPEPRDRDARKDQSTRQFTVVLAPERCSIGCGSSLSDHCAELGASWVLRPSALKNDANPTFWVVITRPDSSFSKFDSTCPTPATRAVVLIPLVYVYARL